MLVTPEIARSWLGYDGPISDIGKYNFPGKRRVSVEEVIKYASAMTSGAWVLNGESIKIDTNGKLIDGNHRCAASIYSGQSFRSLVVFNIEPTAVDTVDIGRVRRPSDVLRMHGFSNTNDKAAVAAVVFRYDNVDPKTIWSAANGPSKIQIIEWVRKHDNQITLVPAIGGLTRSGLMAFFYIARRDTAHPELVDEYFNGLLSGAALPIGDPRLALRNQRLSRWGMGQSELLAHALAWNAFVTGRTLKSIKNARWVLPMDRIK
jgi:hypothetical protein